jgi:hypothetical protein
MIEFIAGFPPNVLAVNCRGHITRADYEEILIPAVEARLKDHKKLRLYYRIGPEFEGIDIGAALDDAKIGLAHISRWERAAIVTDVGWLRLATHAFAFLMPCPVTIYGIGQEADAKAWITG